MAKSLAVLIAIIVISADIGLIAVEAQRQAERIQKTSSVAPRDSLAGQNPIGPRTIDEIRDASRVILRLREANSAPGTATPAPRSDI